MKKSQICVVVICDAAGSTKNWLPKPKSVSRRTCATAGCPAMDTPSPTTRTIGTTGPKTQLEGFFCWFKRRSWWLEMVFCQGVRRHYYWVEELEWVNETKRSIVRFCCPSGHLAKLLKLECKIMTSNPKLESKIMTSNPKPY